MRAFGVLALAACLGGAGCAANQTADPSSILASQSDLARIRQAVAPCLRKAWRPPPKEQAERVALRWRLDEDGRLVGSPEIVNPRVSPYSPAVQAATRAVHACAPFKLPPDQYDLWKEIVFNFDAASMSN
jgi:colicin import membrane protein